MKMAIEMVTWNQIHIAMKSNNNKIIYTWAVCATKPKPESVHLDNPEHTHTVVAVLIFFLMIALISISYKTENFVNLNIS